MPARYCPPVLGGRGRSPEGVKIIDYKKADTQQMSVCQFFNFTKPISPRFLYKSVVDYLP